MEDLTDVLKNISEETILRCQENVDILKNIDGAACHVRMIAYEDLSEPSNAKK